MIRAFEKAPRDRFHRLREGRIHIYMNWVILFIGILTLVAGTTGRIITNKFSNHHVEVFDKGCPAYEGRVQTWTRDIGKASS